MFHDLSGLEDDLVMVNKMGKEQTRNLTNVQPVRRDDVTFLFGFQIQSHP